MPFRLFSMTLCVLILSVLSGCAPAYQEPGQATVAFQHTRAAALGTSVAKNVQRTVTMQALNDSRLATATAQVLQSQLQTAQNWPVVLEEPFNTLERWPSVDDGGERAKSQWSIVDGRYHWEVQSVLDVSWWVYPDMEPVEDFYLSVEVTRLSGPDTSKAGVIFRLLDDANFYLAEMNGLGEIGIYQLAEGSWRYILSVETGQPMPPGQPWRFEVIGQGSSFLVLLNDATPIAFSDDALSKGKTGVVIGLVEGEQQGTWEFDNFVVRSP
jgi:hypothetical protein